MNFQQLKDSQNLNTKQYPIYISVQILTVDYNQNLTTFFTYFVRRRAWMGMLKFGYCFDNRGIMTNFALSHCCRFGKCGL